MGNIDRNMFAEQTVQDVWDKATVVKGYDKDNVRQDACGAWIIRNHYGMRDSDFGWEIDHVYPLALGGDDDPANLRAMHWENNLAKGDDYPSYQARVQADGTKNVHVEGQFTVNAPLRSKLEKLYSK